MKIEFKTTVDISATGTTHRRWQDIEYTDHTGQFINSAELWGRSRNQQRNWETVVQVLGLRAQPVNLSLPVKQEGDPNLWTTVFEIETPDVFKQGDDSLSLLVQDFESVPVVSGLTENVDVGTEFRTNGINTNVWFKIL
jgi:hypothetical protein